MKKLKNLKMMIKKDSRSKKKMRMLLTKNILRLNELASKK
jgi:hypothetical protein